MTVNRAKMSEMNIKTSEMDKKKKFMKLIFEAINLINYEKNNSTKQFYF